MSASSIGENYTHNTLWGQDGSLRRIYYEAVGCAPRTAGRSSGASTDAPVIDAVFEWCRRRNGFRKRRSGNGIIGIVEAVKEHVARDLKLVAHCSRDTIPGQGWRGCGKDVAGRRVSLRTGIGFGD